MTVREGNAVGIGAEKSRRLNAFTSIREYFFITIERIRRLNSSQKKVMLGMTFFLLINALILAISIIVFSLLMKKL
jgi:hypothetical protein